MNKLSLPTVPPPITVITGEEDGPNRVKEDFFVSILSFLGYGERETAIFTERKNRILSVYDPISPRHSDDVISMLIVRGVLVASVIYWRNNFNNVCVVYAHYLNGDVIKRTRWC